MMEPGIRRELTKFLESNGITVLSFEASGRHTKMQITNGKASCFAIVSNSPSDWRAFRNILKYAKRDLAKFEGKQK